MYELRQNNMYEKEVIRITRANEEYKFDPTLPHMGLYAKSPYYIGANMWNRLLVNLQTSNNKGQLKKKVGSLLKNP